MRRIKIRFRSVPRGAWAELSYFIQMGRCKRNPISDVNSAVAQSFDAFKSGKESLFCMAMFAW